MIEEWIDTLDPDETFEAENGKFTIMAYQNAKNSYLYYRKQLIEAYSNPDSVHIDGVMNSKMYFNFDEVPLGNFIIWTEDIGAVEVSDACTLRAILHTNRMLQLRGYVFLSDFYEYLGVKDYNIDPTAKNKGWDIDMLFEYGVQWLDIYLIKHERLFNEPVYSFLYDIEPVELT